MDLRAAEDETLDAFFHGRIQVLQKKKGYRFSIDAPLLADFIRTEEKDQVLELGMGSGIISLLLSLKPFRHITGLEIQDSLFDLAKRNVRLNGLQDRITILHCDLATYASPQKYDLIFSNPPYLACGRGHVSESREKSVAKHELKCDISDIMRKTAELLDRQGRACFVFPESRRTAFFAAFDFQGLQVRRERAVKSHADRAPNLFLIELGFSAGSGLSEAPLILFREDGVYSEEACEIFSGRGHDQAFKQA